MTGFRRLYGSNPLHLLAHLGLFFIAGWAIDQIIASHKIVIWLVWFLGAALLHDFVLLPLYSAVGTGIQLATRGRDRGPDRGRERGAVNYVRVPLAVAGILLLVYFPVILGYSSTNYRADTGHALTGYTRNWLLVCAGLFLASGLVFVVRAARSGRRSRLRPRSPPR